MQTELQGLDTKTPSYLRSKQISNRIYKSWLQIPKVKMRCTTRAPTAKPTKEVFLEFFHSFVQPIRIHSNCYLKSFFFSFLFSSCFQTQMLNFINRWKLVELQC